MLIAFGAQSRVHLFVLHLLHHLFEFLNFRLKLVAFRLNDFDFLIHKLSLILKLQLLEFFVFDVHFHSAAGGLEVQQVLGQLRVLVVLVDFDVRTSGSRVDKAFDLVASA